jgi:hypothetical protein
MIAINCIGCGSPIPLHEEAYGEFEGQLACPVCGSMLRLETAKPASQGAARVVRLSLASVVEVNTA